MAGWYIRRDDKIGGPVDLPKLQRLVANGRLHPTDKLAKDVAGPWNEAGRTTLFANPKQKSKSVTQLPARKAIVSTTKRPPKTVERAKFKRNVLGGYTVSYDCPQCSASLKSRIDEAGQQVTCPECGRQFIVPGATERDRIHNAKITAEEYERNLKEEHHLREEQRKKQNELELAAKRTVEQAARQEQQRAASIQTRPCPYCGAEILTVSKKCRHCGEYLEGNLHSSHPGTQPVELIDITPNRKRNDVAQFVLDLGPTLR